jgi:uncharacterized repeat protein (TIGR01451 family)
MPPYQPAPPQQACPPSGPPAPVLAMKAILPAGMTLSVNPGTRTEQGFSSGAIFGFRPGFLYRLKLDTIPERPGQVLYPTLEVRGSVIPRPNLKYMDFPAPIFITQDDLDRVFAGGVVTKVIYLEHPERGIPSEAKPDRPIEIRSEGEREAFKEAELNGRIAAVLRLGDREPVEEELARLAIDGTILLPGETRLGMPSAPPMVPCYGLPLYDPILGPKANPEECFPNGGDGGRTAGIGPGGRLGGLDPTDVVAEYSNGGKRKIAISNIVCICSPRFVIRRIELLPSGVLARTTLGGVNQSTKQNVFAQREKSVAAIARERTLGAETRLRPGGTISMVALHALGTKSRPQAAFRVDGIRAVGTVVEPDELTSIPEGLVITKSVEPAGAVQSGDVLTVTIRYHNTGRKAVTDLTISDNLSPRLEYVPGSAAADRPSNVSTLPNEVGSSIVQFELPGPIPAAAKGIVQFQVKVR